MAISKNRTKLALGLCALVALAACGSSSKSATVTPGGQPAASTSPTTPTSPVTPTTKAPGAPDASTPVVRTAASTSLGLVLVDAKGMTLYTLTNGDGQAVACTGQCASFWPPLTVPAAMMMVTGAAGVTALGTTPVTGGRQVTVRGLPVYRFSLDKAPGDTKGEGISSFGGTWHVAKTEALSTNPPPPVVTSPPATMPPATMPPATSPPAAPPTTNLYGY